MLPLKWAKEVLWHAHDAIASGHQGFLKTYFRIIQTFYWFGMKDDIINYVKTCRECQFRKHRNEGVMGNAGCVPIPDEPLALIALDVVGPLPITRNKNQYIVTATDQMTKFAQFALVPNQEAHTVSEAIINEMFCRTMPPNILLTDNGGCFIALETQRLLKEWGVKHVKTTTFHPSSNPDERYNKTLGTSLSIVCNANKTKQWDLLVPRIVYSYNSSIHSSSQFSPLKLLIGLTPNLPIAKAMKVDNKSDAQNSEMLDSIEKVRKIAKNNIIVSQKRNMSVAQKKRIPMRLSVGKQVLVRDKAIKKHMKLLHKYKGPYVIVEVLPHTLRLKLPRGDPQIVITAHLDSVKEYFSRETFKLKYESESTNDLMLTTDGGKGIQ